MPNLPRQPRPANAPVIRQAWADEHVAARRARTDGDKAAEWAHLERAHILSQPFAVAHIRTHLAMLGFGIRHRDRREITGQLLRLLVAGIGSAIGRYPLGNTGGANVDAFTPMPVPGDLEALLHGAAGVASSPAMAHVSTTNRALGFGVAFGIAQAAVAMAFWWLEASTVHAMMVTLIAAVYVGFAVSDGRTNVIIVESAIVAAFFIASATAVTLTPWLFVAIYLAHGVKDLWQHRTQFVRGTRWWPPFCFAVDFTVAAIVATQLLLGVNFRS